MAELRENTWSLGEWYDQAVAGNADYESTVNTFYMTGENEAGELGQNDIANRSSPVQVPGSWTKAFRGDSKSIMGLKSDNTLWVWGRNTYGQSAQNNVTPGYSSPVQIPGTWSSAKAGAMAGGLKTDGTLWTWGFNNGGGLGQNQSGPGNSRSSPVQITGTWSKFYSANYSNYAIKNNDQLYVWGYGNQGQLGHGSYSQRSSPVQLPGSWIDVSAGGQSVLSVKDDNTMWSWGNNSYGQLGIDEGTGNHKNSPVQIPGTTWKKETNEYGAGTHAAAIKTDGTLWMWGYGDLSGVLGQNQANTVSSPIQVPGTTWANVATASGAPAIPAKPSAMGVKTDGTLWAWGSNESGRLGQNNQTYYSSPTQIPGTTWATGTHQLSVGGYGSSAAIKTDGTLWVWGYNDKGTLGQNNNTLYSSPVQIPGTTWRSVLCSNAALSGTKTDGSLWVWGNNAFGLLGQNVPDNNHLSSPVQITGSWKIGSGMTGFRDAGGVKTDGTAWSWGYGTDGIHGLNQPAIKRSSPTQIPGTNWSQLVINSYYAQGLKTDGTLWSWGYNYKGCLGLNQSAGKFSSPVQVPGTDWTALPTKVGPYKSFALRRA